MAKIGIIAALDCELETFLRDFSAVETDVKGIYKGEYKGNEIYMSLSGIGKVNSATATQKMIDKTNVDYIINSGVAGGVSRELGVLDLAISSELTYHDFYPIDVLDKYAPGASVFKADKRLASLAEKAAELLNHSGEKFKYKTGMIVSGDRFVEDSAYCKELSEKYNALCTEMEGAAIAHTALLNGKPFIVIRTLSDNADEEANVSFETMAAVAAKRASFIVKEIIANI